MVREPIRLNKINRCAEKHEKKIRKRIERYEEQGKHRAARLLRRLYLHSQDPKIAATQEANKRLKNGQRARKSEAHEIASTLDPRQTQGTATYRAEPKKVGYRPVVNFDLRARATQVLLKRAVSASLHIRPDQFAITGGRPAAERRVAEAVAAGYEWFIECDVRQCYASLNPAGVIELLRALPGKVVEANALSMRVKASIRTTKGKTLSPLDLSKLQQEVRSGVPQGSALSPLVAEAAMAAVLDDAEQRPSWPKAVRLVCYADNVAILGPTQADVECARDILEGAFHRARIGSLKLRWKDARSIDQGFDFLGTRFVARGRRISVEASPASRSRYVTWLNAALKDYDTPLCEIRKAAQRKAAAMDLRQEGKALTKASHWAAAVWEYALGPLKLRGRELRTMAAYEHKVLHIVGYWRESWR